VYDINTNAPLGMGFTKTVCRMEVATLVLRGQITSSARTMTNTQ
jgi:hypothetical protein